ncbi:Putative Mg2+ transporter protein, CorA-like/Zinc transport protein ZntB [Septoria linicola]|uniref:Mg2+ transporter protein, CorA-like/Zinc transport protein ZntB n=1 Tax=Septoria linicola TaxID=215465 RepID=A0A9Q9AUV6_9PEZI|nr:putative Mg2+ transporter protein, CorA-like/Zinc transport protein ZntB [Septoria linicola]USW56302.1 Putative Mg2+ transporter protein, CorA-like/Zinc transport protein ZntB [Septoria linicola]
MASQQPQNGDIASIAGPPSMAKPGASGNAGECGNAQNASSSGAAGPTSAPAKKKRHRAGKRHRKNRRQSFIAPSEAATEDTTDAGDRPSLLDASHHASQKDSFYRVQGAARRASNTSLESEALLDHREHAPLSRRRDTIRQGFARVAMPFSRHQHRPSDASGKLNASRSRLAHSEGVAISEDEDADNDGTERSPLLGSRSRKPYLSRNNSALQVGGYGSNNGHASRGRHGSTNSKASSRRGPNFEILTAARNTQLDGEHDVNNPPSMPGSPTLGGMDDVYMHGLGSSMSDRGRDAVIHIDEDDDERFESRSPESMRRRPTLAQLAERDVCFPGDDDATEHGEGSPHPDRHEASEKPRRRRGRKFPDLEVLEEWSREEKEERTQQEVLRAKKISEPVMVGGRLRPAKTVWHPEADDSPFRFTYFNEMLDGTVHARTISDLQEDGLTFRDLFLPDPIELSDDSDDEDEQDDTALERPLLHQHHRTSSDGTRKNVDAFSQADDSRAPSVARASIVNSIANSKAAAESAPASASVSGHATPKAKRKRYGPRPTFWLDVLSPTENEMKILSRAFGIHQLTSEDILMDEPREKVELFPSYYFVNYRTFEQDKDSEVYMEPINMYVIVFRDGVISFHHSMSPHPANVRRRIRQLNDYMSPTADWISYAIIDDVTDVYAPLVTEIEQEVDDIDEEILYMHRISDPDSTDEKKVRQVEKKEQRPKSSKGDRRDSDASANKPEGEEVMSGGDMLRRVGGCRKKVMGLYRLLGNKADVIKGFAKRCNEHWEVAPRSEIGLYLGDIQDHIVTMTGNLSHYESLLSRAHGNYVAQINIRMNERAEQNADVLGKLTVLGTIVLPMNIVTGMWGMNVWVPGQEYEGDLTWFFCITAGLIAFGLACYFIAKRVYGIV